MCAPPRANIILGMAKFTEEELDKIKSHCINNGLEILHSERCACLFCRHVYGARTVSDWDDTSGTISAICPECGMPYVIGDKSGYDFDAATLRDINKALFGAKFMAENPNAARTYISRYAQGKITPKAENEALYAKYLTTLKDSGDASAAFALGDFYQYRAEFVPLDPAKAFEIFSSTESLAMDPESLDRLGLLYLDGLPKGRKDAKNAFICFTKSAVSGCPFGLMHYYDCFVNGYYVKTDVDYAMSEIVRLFGNYAREFARSENCSVLLPMSAFRIAATLMGLKPQRKEDFYVILYYSLYAHYAFHCLLPDEAESSIAAKEDDLNESLLSSLMKIMRISSRDKPILDQDTFLDSTSNSGFGSARYALGVEAVATEGDFDPGEHTFRFSVHYSSRPIIVDLHSAFFGKGPQDVRWNFREVANVSIGYGEPFNLIESKGDVVRFVNVTRDAETVVGVISFLPTKKVKKGKKGKTRKNGNNQA